MLDEIAKAMVVAITLNGYSGEHDVSKVDLKSLECLAHNIIFESGVEDRTGKDAVAHVTLNRVQSDIHPNTICSVIYQRAQFSWTLFPRKYMNNKSKFVLWRRDENNELYQIPNPDGMKMWEESVISAIEAMLGITKDPTCGATYYFNPNLARPKWKYWDILSDSCIGENGVHMNHRFLVDSREKPITVASSNDD